jgi:hypothetical protein
MYNYVISRFYIFVKALIMNYFNLFSSNNNDNNTFGHEIRR